MSKGYIFVVADETEHAGDRDSAIALALELKARGVDEDLITFIKVAQEGKTNASTSLEAFKRNSLGEKVKLPVSNNLYANLPNYDTSYFSGHFNKIDHIEVIGVGENTLDTALDIAKDLKQPTNVSYMTHMIHEKVEEKIKENNVQVFAPIEQRDDMNHVVLDAVPHTNSNVAIKSHYDEFMKTRHGESFQSLTVEKTNPFAFVVLNAGFTVNGEHYPSSPVEAYEHGKMLAKRFDKETDLIIAHGGPRNLKDDELNDDDNMNRFVTGYREGMKSVNENFLPLIIEERFEFGLDYNIVKVGYEMSKSCLCKAFISNAEGYGTMDGATLHVDNTQKLLGMFCFNAIRADPTGQRQKNLLKYIQKGVRLIETVFDIDRVENAQTTPIPQVDPARVILDTIGLNAAVEDLFAKPSL